MQIKKKDKKLRKGRERTEAKQKILLPEHDLQVEKAESKKLRIQINGVMLKKKLN
jgi:hypothetical protein